MRLVHDNEVEAADAEFARVAVDKPDHGLVCGEDDAGVFVAVVAGAGEHGCGHVRKQLVEVLMRLTHKAGAVGKKQHVFDPVRFHKHFDQRNRYAGFARSRCHDDDAASTLLVLEDVADAANGVFLVVAVRDAVFDGRVRYVLVGVCALL